MAAIIAIVSGCPGSGKTTLAKSLAARSKNGVHLATDEFYHFLAHRLDPSSSEAAAQNKIVVRAFLSAAQSFSDNGCDVYVDGVIGPWWLEEIAAMFMPFEFTLLHADLDTVLQRTSQRSKTSQSSAKSALVRTMHMQFDALRGYEERTINTSGRGTVAIMDEYIERQAKGDFHLS